MNAEATSNVDTRAARHAHWGRIPAPQSALPWQVLQDTAHQPSAHTVTPAGRSERLDSGISRVTS